MFALIAFSAFILLLVAAIAISADVVRALGRLRPLTTRHTDRTA